MNNEEDILVRQSKWSGRRVVLFYWFAIAFMGTAVAAGLGSSVLEPSFKFDTMDHSGIAEPFHPEDCLPCHQTTYDSWNTTFHSGASRPYNSTHLIVGFNSNSIYSYAFWNSSSCAHCMTTGWDNSTGTPTYDSLGVTCAACHSPGVVNDSTDVCLSCHHNGADWAKSAHPNSLTDLLSSGHASDSCLHCMSGQGMYTDVTGMDPEDPSLTGINCATCHDPHDPTNDYQLREASAQELCGTCHGTSERHTTIEMLTDEDTTSVHGAVECTDCHGYYLDDGEPAVNHTWTLVLSDACGQCHTDNASRIAILDEIQANTTELISMFEAKLENVSAKVDEVNATGADVTNAYTLIDEAEALVLFVESDGSTGFHNPELAKDKLMLALTKLEEAYTAAVDAEGSSAPGFEFLSIILAFSLVGITTAVFRKRRQ